MGKYLAEVGKRVEKLNARFRSKDSSLRMESFTNRLSVLTIVVVVLTMTQSLGYLYGTSSAEAVGPHNSPCRRESRLSSCMTLYCWIVTCGFMAFVHKKSVS